GSGYNDNHDRITLPKQNENGSRTGTCQGPSHTEYGSASQVFFPAFIFCMELNRLAFQVTEAIFFYYRNHYHSGNYGRTYNTIHKEGLKPKHFLDAVPGNGFGFCHDNAEKNTSQDIFYCFHDLI